MAMFLFHANTLLRSNNLTRLLMALAHFYSHESCCSENSQESPQVNGEENNCET